MSSSTTARYTHLIYRLSSSSPLLSLLSLSLSLPLFLSLFVSSSQRYPSLGFSLSLSLSPSLPPRYVSMSIMRVGVLARCIRACKYVKHVRTRRCTCTVVLDARRSMEEECSCGGTRYTPQGIAN